MLKISDFMNSIWFVQMIAYSNVINGIITYNYKYVSFKHAFDQHIWVNKTKIN